MRKILLAAMWLLIAFNSYVGVQYLVSHSYDSTGNAAEVGNKPKQVSDKTYRYLRLFGDVLSVIQDNYVKDTDESELIKAAIHGMVSTLGDPFSIYLSEDSKKEMNKNIRGEFGGLGIQVQMEENGRLKIVNPLDDTPAFKAGLQPGDTIVKIENSIVQGMTLEEAVRRMRGPIGSPITITVVRKGMEEPFEVRLIRALIKIQSVKWHVEEEDIAYIRITHFNDHTYNGLLDAINGITKSTDLKGAILDIRNNPGGLLDQAIKIVDTFLEKGEIVSVRGRDWKKAQRHNARPRDRLDGKPLVVLINGGSASASEIVAGALQDHSRATVVGSPSFGKASIQTIQELGEGNGAVKLTTAHYYTPSGSLIHKKGIQPDIEILQEIPEELRIGNKQNNKADPSCATFDAKTNDDGKKKRILQLYIPRDAKKDKALNTAYKLIRDIAIKEGLTSKSKTSRLH